jgi:translation initiation factor IF-2
VSAKNLVNIKELESKLEKVIKKEVDLREDHSSHALCFVLDSNFDEKTNLISATVLVKSGVLKLHDTFISGQDEGRIRTIFDDQHKPLQEAFPGMSVLLEGGFKYPPEVGHPLYIVDSHETAQFITHRVKVKREREHGLEVKDLSDKVHDMRKQVHGLGKIERGKWYGGDRTI